MVVVPTIDDFKDNTVMRSLRKVVNYIINTVVPAINTADTNASSAISTAQQAQTTAQQAHTIANNAQTTADTTTTKLNELITQFNIMVTYVGSDSELVTGTAPTNVTPISTSDTSIAEE